MVTTRTYKYQCACGNIGYFSTSQSNFSRTIPSANPHRCKNCQKIKCGKCSPVDDWCPECRQFTNPILQKIINILKVIVYGGYLLLFVSAIVLFFINFNKFGEGTLPSWIYLGTVAAISTISLFFKMILVPIQNSIINRNRGQNRITNIQKEIIVVRPLY
ncbi:MAG: hypothetical protein ACTSRK_20805 [Promethearchaeota archaeon]